MDGTTIRVLGDNDFSDGRIVQCDVAECGGLIIGGSFGGTMENCTAGYYGQIWFNRDYTYECAVEEMPAGYAETLMQYSPNWALPVVVIGGIVISAVIYRIAAKIFRFED